MKKMRWSVLFEQLMVVFIILVGGLVMVTGFFAYRELNTVISYVKVPVADSKELTGLRGIISELSNTERDAKSFYLTRNGNYLGAYYASVIKLGDKIDRSEAAAWADPRQQACADSIVDLIETEMRIFNELIYLDNNEHVTDQLQTISDQVERIRPDTAVVKTGPVAAAPEVKKKKSFFSRVFGNRKPEVKDTVVPVQTSVPAANPIAEIKKDIKKQVVRVGLAQKEELKRLKNREQELTAKNTSTSAHIQILLAKIEQLERDAIKNRNDKAARSAASSIRLLTGFGALILALLLVTAIITVRYIYTTRQKKALLRKDKQRAQGQAEARQRFLSNMSHEMRTPLNSVIGFLEQVLGTDLNEQQREQISIAKKSSDHLLHVINTILDSSKLENGKLRFDELPFSPGALISEVLQSMDILARAKKLTLKYEPEGRLPDTILGDPLRLRQIILNITGNAIKFTASGTVTLKALVKEKQLHIEVTDTGSGIPEDKLESIFMEYEQVGDNNLYGGTGLGLTITKNLVEQQGGAISIRSRQGEGTTVSLFIPYKETDQQLPENTAALTDKVNAMAGLAGKRVLVADDEQFNRMLLMAILKKNGILFQEAINGKEVLDLLDKNSFDLILMDVRMPEMNGLEATVEIRKMSDPLKAAVPVIALTAGLASEKLERCRQAGMNEFIAKPCRENELLDKMAMLLLTTDTKTNH